MVRKYVRKTNRPYRCSKPQAVAGDFEPGFMARLDGRTEVCRALRQRFQDLSDDLGGRRELSGIKASLLERFLFLESSLMRIECEIAGATDAKLVASLMGPWVQATNSLLGLARTLGVERQAKTVDLRSYVEANGTNGENGDI